MRADSTPARVLFMGSKHLGVRALEALAGLADIRLEAMTIDDRADGRNAYDELAAACHMRGIPYTVVHRRSDASAAVRAAAPDLVVVCGWYWIVPASDLQRVPKGFVGIHFSPLPRYRGGSPLVWQLINGEPEVGISLFSFTDGVDEGPVWARRFVTVGVDDTVGDVLPRLEERAVQLLTEYVPEILRGDLQPTPQNSAGATSYPMRVPEDGLISWDQPARRIHDFVRAQSKPYPGAFTFVGAQRVSIWKTTLADEMYQGPPGQIARVGTDGVCVVCGDRRGLIVERAGIGGSDGPALEMLPSTSLRLHGPSATRS